MANDGSTPLKQAEGEIKMLPIKRLRLDFQPKDRLVGENVEWIASSIARGDKIEPVRVFFDSEIYWLADGFHRVAAARRLGRRKIQAEVVHGSYEDMMAEWRQGVEVLKQMWSENASLLREEALRRKTGHMSTPPVRDAS